MSKEDSGDRMILAAAELIVRSVATSKAAAEEMVRILSAFDSRFAAISITPEPLPAEAVIRRCDSSEDLIFLGPPSQAEEYLAAVDALLASGRSGCDGVLSLAMVRLEEEFRCLLSRATVPPTFGVPSFPVLSMSVHGDDHDSSNLDAVMALRDIADRMIAAGFAQELSICYTAVRRELLLESMSGIGVDAVTIDEVKRMEWSVLDIGMKHWSSAVGPVVRGLLAGERSLCDQVFASSSAELAGECFSEAAKPCIMRLLSFADAVAAEVRSPEKLNRIVGMYVAVADVKDELAALFTGGGDAAELVADEADQVLGQFISVARRMVDDLGCSIRTAAVRKPVQGGDVHPMLRYVMNYLLLVVDNRSTLDTILLSSGEDNHQTPTAHCITALITAVESKIEESCLLYSNVALRHFFLMNNFQYLYRKAVESDLKSMLGDAWLLERRRRIRQQEASYFRSAWPLVLALLREDGAGAKAVAGAREKIRRFNAAFEEVYRSQTAWKMPDEQMSEELRIAVAERLLPAYRAFECRFRSHLGRAMRHSAEDLEAYVSDLFRGEQKVLR